MSQTEKYRTHTAAYTLFISGVSESLIATSGEYVVSNDQYARVLTYRSANTWIVLGVAARHYATAPWKVSRRIYDTEVHYDSLYEPPVVRAMALEPSIAFHVYTLHEAAVRLAVEKGLVIVDVPD